MGFYKNVLISAIVQLIILLAILGTFMSYGNKKIMFPAALSDCPDYYTLNAVGQCESNLAIYQSNPRCDIGDFTGDTYKVPGMGSTSGVCKKKQWASACKITWDGITNNTDICYSS
jgi:hypothetical protein